tara:strand:+ start:1015 stop:1125 length:111 start_codon:yes stop_codon:yes gene_type:complete
MHPDRKRDGTGVESGVWIFRSFAIDVLVKEIGVGGG